MEVRSAVALAKSYVQTLFAEEGVRNITLEEVDYDEAQHAWLVTVGFSRRDPSEDGMSVLAAAIAIANEKMRINYKIVKISDATEKVLSVKNRD